MHERESRTLLAVRIVHLAAGSTATRYWGSFNVVVQVLGYCPRMTDLRLFVGNMEASPGLSEDESRALSALSDLRRLKIVGKHHAQESAAVAFRIHDLVQIVAARLECLEVSNIHGTVWSAASRSEFPHLTAAVIIDCGASEVTFGVFCRDEQRFRLAGGTHDAQGFWKMSWQRTTEAELLTKLHGNGWVPGLVRHHPETSMRDEDGVAVFHPSGDSNVGRVREILHLGSIGQPLSQCESVEEMLDTMYDLIETHAHVCELGVLHRDVSYFNSLCNPKHYLTTHPVLGKNCVLERPCIKKIFGDANGQPCALLTDLDHGTTFEELAKGPLNAAKTVGTPMFMSVYLEAPSAPRKYQRLDVDDLFDKLVYVEKTRPDLFHRAFPGGDGGFIDKYRLVMENERHRRTAGRPSPVPEARHDWRHDAESIYWVFLYAFARARPLGTGQEGALESHAYHAFCQVMLSNSTEPLIGSPAREAWMEPSRFKEELFAPEISILEGLFEQMAIYLSLPWHIYCGEDQPMAKLPGHVHIAFRRLILWFKLEPNHAEVLRVALDTESGPRLTNAFNDDARKYAMATDKRGNTGASQMGSSTHETRSSSALKRKAEAEAAAVTGEYDRSTKKLRTSPLGATDAQTHDATAENDSAAQDMGSASVTVNNDTAIDKDGGHVPDDAGAIVAASTTAPVAETDQAAEDHLENQDAQAKEPEPEPEPEHYDPALHRDSLLAKALRLMFWKDRALWFGRGK
ncbi:hypothetical protein AURDEDRAFT_158095 [Auricularia subglabra TFB-10046 SS5]|nr:hypothetical protein AURDEDRAFT_158095 [Auricularia subglabra TFB-10046 SS5]